MKQRSWPLHEILISKAISRGKYVMCTYLVTRHDSSDGAFLGYVGAYPTLASAEAFAGRLNKCQVVEASHAFCYGVEVEETLSETKSDALLISHGLYGLI
jgi:hypothetical protein